MKIDSEFQDAVKSNDIDLVRMMLKDSIIIDPTLDMYKVLSSYAKANLSMPLYEKYNGIAFADEVDWNEDYFNQELINLINNFSEERIIHLEKVCKKIYSGYINKKEKINNRKKYTKRTDIDKGAILRQKKRKKGNEFGDIIENFISKVNKRKKNSKNKRSKAEYINSYKRNIAINNDKQLIENAIKEENVSEIKNILIKILKAKKDLNLCEDVLHLLDNKIEIYENIEETEDINDKIIDIGFIMDKMELDREYSKIVEELEVSFTKSKVKILQRIIKRYSEISF